MQGGRGRGIAAGADDAGTVAALNEAMRMEGVSDHQKDPRSADQDIDDYAGVDDGIDFQVSALATLPLFTRPPSSTTLNPPTT